MRKIIIVDYSLEIVIAIIIYDHLHWMMFIPLFEATACHIFRYKYEKMWTILYIELVSPLNKQVQICMVL